MPARGRAGAQVRRRGRVARGALRGWRGRQVLHIERDVARHVQIEPPVPVVIAERASGGPAVDGHARLHRDVFERAPARAAIEPVPAEVGDVEILIAVVVEISRADALSPAFVGDARRDRHVAKRAASRVAEQRRPRHAASRAGARRSSRRSPGRCRAGRRCRNPRARRRSRSLR